MSQSLENIVSNPRHHNGVFYHSFEFFIRKAEVWLAHQDFPGAERIFGKKVLQERLIQKIVVETRNHFIQEKVKRGDCSKEACSVKFNRIKSGIFYDAAEGKVGLSAKYKFTALATAAVHCFRMAVSVLKGFFNSRKIHGKADLFYGLTQGEIIREGGDQSFGQFISQGPLKGLFSAPLMVVEMKDLILSANPDRLVYSRNPLGYVLQHWNISFLDRMWLLLRSVRSLLYCVYLVLRQGLFSLVIRDFILFNFVDYLDKKKILNNYIITVSNYTEQQLYLRAGDRKNFRVHMVYYSQNSIPRVFKHDLLRSDLPEWRHIKVDCHWVWTEYYEQYLRSIGIDSEIRVVGPILFYMPENRISVQAAKDISIAVFDVTPCSPQRSLLIGAVYDYYRFENMSKFLLDIVEFGKKFCRENGESIKIRLKHKRPPRGGAHDQRYLDFVRKLCAENDCFQIERESANVFSFIGSASVSVVFPFTSTYIVSSSLKKNAVIYDPTGLLEATHDPLPYVHFASGKKELHELLGNAVRTAIHKGKAVID